MRIAVASGKGGTGKTLVATHLAWTLAAERPDVVYADADVEAPNGHLFLKPGWEVEARASVRVPTLEGRHCSGCGECQRFCAFNGIIALTDGVLVFPELCHGCGGCVNICPEGRLRQGRHPIGTVRWGWSGSLRVHDGVLDVGQVRAAPLIRSVLAGLPRQAFVIVDGPPGTSCSAVAAIAEADHVVLVTEPTPFGLHDLRLALRMCAMLHVPAQVVINRSDLGDDTLERFLADREIPVLARIPFDRDIAEAYAQGELSLERSERLQHAIAKVRASLLAPHQGSKAA